MLAVAVLYNFVRIADLMASGKKIRLQSIVAKARFLNGHQVRAVWSAIFDEDHQRWSRTRLFLGSELHLTPSEIVAP